MLAYLLKNKKKKKTVKQLQEEQLIKERGLEKEYEEIEDPMFVAQVNFETMKSIFKRKHNISGSNPKKGYTEKFQIIRGRETNSSGKVIKSIDTMKIKVDSGNERDVLRYLDMTTRMFGVTGELDPDDGVAKFYYDIQEIQKVREIQKRKKEQ